MGRVSQFLSTLMYGKGKGSDVFAVEPHKASAHVT